MHIDGKRKSLVPLLLKNHDFENITLSLLKRDLKKNVCLINQITKVCTFYIITHFIGCALNC